MGHCAVDKYNGGTWRSLVVARVGCDVRRSWVCQRFVWRMLVCQDSGLKLGVNCVLDMQAKGVAGCRRYNKKEYSQFIDVLHPNGQGIIYIIIYRRRFKSLFSPSEASWEDCFRRWVATVEKKYLAAATGLNRQERGCSS